MKKVLFLSLMAIFAITLIASATPDPWRIAITDYNANAREGDNFRGYGIWPLSWGTNGGTFQRWGHDGTDYGYGVDSFNATTGAIALGALTPVSIAGIGSYPITNVVKAGSTYKMWHWILNDYTGHDVQYCSSTDAINWTAPTDVTVYGKTAMATGSYGVLGAYRSTGGVYLRRHGNTFACYQLSNGNSLDTSAEGDTLWWDIDTGNPDPFSPYDPGDPIADPHTAGSGYEGAQQQYGHVGRGCTGDLFFVASYFPDYGYPGGTLYNGEGVALTMGSGGELNGGDHYSFLADADDQNTENIGNSLLGAIDLAGLAGPSLRARWDQWSWSAWRPYVLGLKANVTDPSGQFMMEYTAAWDTDSSGDGSTFDEKGIGRAKLLLTRNKADLNADGTVNALDISGFSGAYGTTSGQTNYNGACDFNGDGKVNAVDISGFSGRYGTNCHYGE